MIRINLLPVRTTKRQEAVRSQLLMAGTGAIALVVVLVLFHMVMITRVATAESDVRELKAEVERMKTVAAQAEQEQKLKEDLQRKLDVIKRLNANRTGPVRMLDELADATPEKLTLTSLDEDKGRLRISGYAVSNEVISQFLSNLEQSDYFEDVYLNSIEQQDKDNVSVKVFSVTARLVVPGTEVEADAAEAGADQ
ncbi:MAG: hypothetical protein D6798_06740 [Deltaproteobacteria bacterium]|nr:MAG: hypothetical protein D6798_06740 [Deltaproteobacteria bacterium]